MKLRAGREAWNGNYWGDYAGFYAQSYVSYAYFNNSFGGYFSVFLNPSGFWSFQNGYNARSLAGGWQGSYSVIFFDGIGTYNNTNIQTGGQFQATGQLGWNLTG